MSENPTLAQRIAKANEHIVDMSRLFKAPPRQQH
jgi:hypothetical protein